VETQPKIEARTLEKDNTEAERRMHVLPASVGAAVESNTSIPSLLLQSQHGDDDDDDGKEDDAENRIPDEAFLLEGASSMLVCPISFKLMTSAVIAMDTQSYQKEALEEWIERCKSKGIPLTSPLTNAPMEPRMMANETVRGLVREHIEARGQAWRRHLTQRKSSRRGHDGERRTGDMLEGGAAEGQLGQHST